MSVPSEIVETRMRAFRRACADRGIKVTHQRLEIFQELSKAEDHPSAEEIFERVRTRIPTVSLDTIYRTLETFERLGVISRVEILDDRGRFDPNLEPHHHLVCTVCKSVMDFSWPQLDKLAPPDRARRWGRISGSRMEVRGICSRCLNQEKEK